jgi:hypothetical protein
MWKPRCLTTLWSSTDCYRDSFTFYVYVITICRSQWSRGLKHELSSPARTLGSWVLIPLKARVSVCVYSVFVSSIGSGLATGWSPVQGVVPTVLGLRNWSETAFHGCPMLQSGSNKGEKRERRLRSEWQRGRLMSSFVKWCLKLVMMFYETKQLPFMFLEMSVRSVETMEADEICEA